MIENLVKIDIDKIVESKTNPRKTLDQAQEKELVESVKAKGIITPLSVRQVDGHFEIIDGARRFRAAKAAGFTDVPVIEKLSTDEQAVEEQLISFTQRADIHPLDEAAAYEQLRKKKFDVAQIAAKVGKERSYIAKRLELKKLIPTAKKQMAEGTLRLEFALEIARLPEPLQKAALDDMYYNQPETVQQLRRYLAEDLLMDIKQAPFPIDNPNLLPKAGPCTSCPKRSGNNLDLFGDLSKKGNHCLDRKCYNAKDEAFTADRKAKEKEKAEESGTSKAPVSMARRQKLYKRRLEIFGNRIEGEVRNRLLKALLARLRWPLDRKEFELIVPELFEKWGDRFRQYEIDMVVEATGIKLPGEGYAFTDKVIKLVHGLTDQQLVQLAFAVILREELVYDPTVGAPDDSKFQALLGLSRYKTVDRKKIHSEVAKELEPKRPKPPKVEEKKKAKVKKSVKKSVKIRTTKKKSKK